MKSDSTAFSLLEMLAAIAIISVLLVLSLQGVRQAQAAAERAKCVANLRNAGVAMVQYFQDNNNEFFSGKNWFQYPSTKAKPDSGMRDYFVDVPASVPIADPRLLRDTVLTCPAMKRQYSELYPQALNRGYAINKNLYQKDPASTWNSKPESRPLLAGAPQRIINVPKLSAMWILTEAPVNNEILSALGDTTAKVPRFMPMPHGGRQNVCFLDGHIESLTLDDFSDPSNPREFWGNLGKR